MPPITDSATSLADCRTLYLKKLGALMLGSGLLSSTAIQSIQQGAGAYFDEMIQNSQRGSFRDEVDGLTSSRLTLVGEEELELELRLDNLSARLFEASGNDLWKLYLRFVTLLKRPDLPKTNNPIGPKGIARGIEAMFAAGGTVSLDKKLDLLDRLDAMLLESLPALYAGINDFLDQSGVEAAQAAIITSPEGPRPAGSAPQPNDGAVLALHQRLLARLPQASAATFQPGNELPADPGAALLSQASIERLIFRLNDLDRQGGFAYTPPAEPATSLESLIPGLFSEKPPAAPVAAPKTLSAAELGIPAMAPEGLAIDTLALIFEVIFEQPRLPDALKAVISSLQITLLKVAMLDAGFFTDRTHPVRGLIDKMGQAVLGLPVDASIRHPVYARLFEIAGRLRSEFKSDISIFVDRLADLDALIAGRSAAIAQTAENYLPLLAQLDQQDQASEHARETIERWLKLGQEPAIREFLETHWVRALKAAWLEYGPESPQWMQHLQVIDDLLWTFEPKFNPDDRKALAKRLPDVLKTLKSGMERLGIPPDDQAGFLDTCFALQTRALRTSNTAAAIASPPESEMATTLPSTPEIIAGELGTGELVLKTLDIAGGLSLPPIALPCAPGDWLELSADGDNAVIAQVCQISPARRRILLCNPEIRLALSVHPWILDQQFQAGQARLCSTISLFDEAASRALQRTTAN